MAEYINNWDQEVVVRRIAEGSYVFGQQGSRKALASIKNGHLIVRVGGGSCKIEDFLNDCPEET
jgi:hypothetical protein